MHLNLTFLIIYKSFKVFGLIILNQPCLYFRNLLVISLIILIFKKKYKNFNT